ncbi:MAG TPA: hypothetical protein VFI23_07505 [Rhizomicrobium sp.]|nr:hypothetical protein [Rhizomicrobium sp.]
MSSRKSNFAVFTMGSAAILISGMILASAQNRPAPPPAASVIPASTLDNLPHHDISNGIVSAKVYLPGEGGLYRGTRFDRTGVIAHATYKGQDYGNYWFSSYSPLVHDFIWQNGQVTVSTASGAAGPVEEFGTIGYDEAGAGGKFLKIGVGILKRDTGAYDFVHTYPVVNEGKRGASATKTSVRLTHDLSDKDTGYSYSYVKTVRLVPGKAQMVIEHVLKNTGKKTIETAVYCHNFLTLSTDNSPGDENVTITAPFNISAGEPFKPDAAEVNGKTVRYLRAVREGESVTSPISGFGNSVSDYDFKVTNTKTGFGQRIRADQPLSRINFWSIRTNVSWEPYIAISLKPGETKRWTYTYDYFGPGEG